MFYCFIQNNSGGSFDFDDKKGISHYVIIEADSTKDAIYRAKYIGLYFNGCESGVDCSCCGDRWDAYFAKGDEVPSVYGQAIKKQDTKSINRMKWMKGPEGFIHYKNNIIKPFWDK